MTDKMISLDCVCMNTSCRGCGRSLISQQSARALLEAAREAVEFALDMEDYLPSDFINRKRAETRVQKWKAAIAACER